MKPTTILIADDEKEIADLIGLHLEREGYRIVKAEDGEEAVRCIQADTVDLVVLDIMMPKLDGFEVIRHIRSAQRMPVIFLSAKASDFDKITGLVMGADDYMTKPFNPLELVARVKAQLRREQLNKAQTPDEAIIEAGGLTIYPEKRKAVLYGETLELTPKEFDILSLLAGYPKKVFSVENIYRQVWDEPYYEAGNNTVMVHIRTLRKKLDEDKNKYIKTVWGVGYTFHG